MMVQYHGPSGEFVSTWQEDMKGIALGTVKRNGVEYKYAGTQDGCYHFAEVTK